MAKRGTKLIGWHGLQNCRVPVVWNSFESLQLRPTVELRNGTDVIWQIPSLPKAVLFVAHGCNGGAVNFWDRSSSCPNCIGLPEERLLVLHALARKFAVITISSAGRCWTLGEERIIVKNIIQWWALTHNLESLPLVALGASSGGYFVSALATNLRQQKISEFIEVLKNKGIDAEEVECMEFPLSPSFLADRIPGMNQNVSAKLFELFQVKSFVDGNGYMKKDGRATRWKEALRECKNLVLDKSMVQHVQEELNLAFAYHEMTSLQSEQIFKWFESHLN
ncbi:SECRETION-REGULATING GUANINE NUCLEOTIDE EXCHANGE FACTOR [Salix purpurea]|uniref:SECRETION-REGULATING GUANINE NUCLEOTIDE EXCHANGE FACTOR n=1 Tax=Salix purpurea TaxID=77065 RepID=A0A9Q0SQX8_SALPP|nr:SECRETION-REGULATING GUANINE NUCLEOTIDE EXCHANGE FACTOR [Salix purpurea]